MNFNPLWNRLKIEIDAFLDVRKRTLVLETVLSFSTFGLQNISICLFHLLEPVCCQKRQKIVPDQLLV